MNTHPLAGTGSIGVRLSFKNVFGKDFTRQQLVELLSQYRIDTALDYLGRVSALMYNGSVSTPKTQRELCDMLFRRRSDEVWNAVIKASASPTGANYSRSVVLFDEMSVALTAKIAIFADRTESSGHRTDTEGIGIALLMVNEFFEETAPSFTGASPEDWAYFAFVTGGTQMIERGLHPLARAYEMFLSDKPHLQLSSNYMDLRGRLHSATELSSDEFISVLFAYVTHFISITTANVHIKPAWVDHSKYFEAFSFSEEQRNSFLNLIARSLDVVKYEIDDGMAVTSVHPFNNGTLNRSPCVLIGNRVYCPVLRFLIERITTGVYHQLLNAPAEIGLSKSASADKFQRYVGDIFEDYVDRLVRRVHEQVRGSDREFLYLGPSELREGLSLESKACDHLIFDGSTLILWESKARFLPLLSRVGEDQRQFLERFEALIKRAAAQLASTIELIQAGELTTFGIDPQKIVRILPAIVSLADYPMSPPMFELVQNQAMNFPEFSGGLVRPLEVILIKELENLEGIWSQGTNLGEYLSRKIDDPKWQKNSIHNYIVGHRASLPVTRNAYLDSVFNVLMDRIEQYYRSHSADQLWEESAD